MIQHKVYVDWDYVDLADPFDFGQEIDDISDDVRNRVTYARTKGDEGTLYPAATAEFTVNNFDDKYFNNNPDSVLHDKIRLWLPVRICAVYEDIPYIRYTGFIKRITWSPLVSKKQVYFYCTDGMDLFARTLVVQNMDDKGLMSAGAAFGEVLDAAGWNTLRRVIDGTGGDVISLPATTSFMV